MCLAILPYNPRTIDGKHHFQPLQGRIVDYLIKRTLQKGRIHRKNRKHSLGRKASRKRYSMFLCLSLIHI